MRALGTLVALLLLSGSAWPQTDGVVVPCRDVPKDAVLDLPDPLNRWGAVLCTVYGHLIAPRDGFIWSFPGTFAPVHFPAQMVRSNPKEVGNGAYFVEISVDKLSPADGEKINTEFTKGLGVRHDPVQNVYRLTAKNNSGGVHTAYFLTFPNNDVWGLWCNEQCGRTPPFMVLDMRRQKR